MDQHQLELGGSKATALGSERGPLMTLMILSSTITAIMEIMKTTPAMISTTEKSILVEKIVRGTGKPGESVNT